MANVTLTFDSIELIELVTERVKLEYGREVLKVTINVENHYEDRPCGSTYPQFKNIEVKLGEKLPEQRGSLPERLVPKR